MWQLAKPTRLWGALLMGLAWVLNPVTARGTEVIFDVTLDTVPLIGHPAAPFAINFQLNDGSGSGDGNNNVLIDNFQFAGGAPAGAPTTFGGASGNLATAVMITDTGFFFNSFTQGFTPGNSLTFSVRLTTNVDAGPTPDQFSFAILDSTGAEIPTLGPGGAFLIVNLNSSNPTIQTFPSNPTVPPAGGGPPIATGAPQITLGGVPEPSTLALLGIGTAALFAYGLYRRAKEV